MRTISGRPSVMMGARNNTTVPTLLSLVITMMLLFLGSAQAQQTCRINTLSYCTANAPLTGVPLATTHSSSVFATTYIFAWISMCHVCGVFCVWRLTDDRSRPKSPDPVPNKRQHGQLRPNVQLGQRLLVDAGHLPAQLHLHSHRYAIQLYPAPHAHVAQWCRPEDPL